MALTFRDSPYGTWTSRGSSEPDSPLQQRQQLQPDFQHEHVLTQALKACPHSNDAEFLKQVSHTAGGPRSTAMLNAHPELRMRHPLGPVVLPALVTSALPQPCLGCLQVQQRQPGRRSRVLQLQAVREQAVAGTAVARPAPQPRLLPHASHQKPAAATGRAPPRRQGSVWLRPCRQQGEHASSDGAAPCSIDTEVQFQPLVSSGGATRINPREGLEVVFARQRRSCASHAGSKDGVRDVH